MLKIKCHGQEIKIYDDNKLLGYMWPSYLQDEHWGISTSDNLFFDITMSFDKIFFRAFNRQPDDFPGLRAAMKKTWEEKQAETLMDIMSGSSPSLKPG